eukprot:GGOE01053042.1.p1 GENE.GGOE01053042.1~~GGOE01053042.1.p1  ORF type:complete len:749 (-),score=178.86 GGOE01053042.1:153-2399(-)
MPRSAARAPVPPAPKLRPASGDASGQRWIRWVTIAVAAIAVLVQVFIGWSDVACWMVVTQDALLSPEYEYLSPPCFSAEYNSSMLWGTYRPHLYFGMRTRTAAGVLTGILWRGQQSGLRHTAEDGEHVLFGWQHHDGRGYGQQSILDREVGLEMTITVVRQPRGRFGGDWAVRFTGYTPQPVIFAHYVVMEGKEPLQVVGQSAAHVAMSSATPELGAFTLVLSHRHTAPNASWVVKGKRATKEPWNLPAPPLFRQELKGNENVLQVSTVLEGSFRIEVALVSHEGRDSATLQHPTAMRAVLLQEGLMGCAMDVSIARRRRAFIRRFDETFGLQARGLSQAHVQMARAALSSYLGGLGFWHGRGLRFKDADHPERGTLSMDPAELFSGVPSRSKFPRGFLWDEGFHQLLAARWDEELAKDVILHWMHLMDPAGWIPREQILGPEPRTRVPAEFVPQTPTHANPPTLALQIQNFALDNPDGRHSAFLEAVWPYLERWVEWFRTSQAGATNTTFRWRGRKGYHLLACGLDDYPRSSCDTDAEAHVDLYSWVTLMTSTIQSIGAAIGKQTAYGEVSEKLTSSLNAVHWDAKRRQFSDRSGCPPTPGQLATPKFLRPFGYVNLFPVLTGVADMETAAHVVNRSWELMTGFGLRSLREQDARRIGRSDNYWTGPIWINLNYLMLRALHTRYATVPGAAELYRQLRQDLVANILAEHQRTGKLWENYNASSGRGQGTAPFTGWTVLVVLIMDEKY